MKFYPTDFTTICQEQKTEQKKYNPNFLHQRTRKLNKKRNFSFDIQQVD